MTNHVTYFCDRLTEFAYCVHLKKIKTYLLTNYLCSRVFQGIFLAEHIFIPYVGLRAFPNVVAYNMSKAAVDQLTRTCALEVADRGVRV